MPRSLFALLVSFLAQPILIAEAVESGGQRGLQTGPAGDGAAFQNIGRTDLEASLGVGTLTGDVRTGDNSQTIAGNTMSLALAAGYGVNENLNFTIEFNRKSADISGETSDTPSVSSSLTRSHTQIAAGPALWVGNTLLAAHASVTSWDKETYKDGSTVVTTGSALIPRIKTFLGMRTGSITAAVRSVLYNDARVKRSVYTDTDGTVTKDHKRRMAAETSIDGRLQLTQFTFAGSLTYVNAERASDDQDSRDYFIYGFGGHHMAADWLTLVGGLQYTDAHYNEAKDASIFYDNLGGLQIDLGLHYIVQNLTGTCGLGYTIPELLTYRSEGSTEDTKVERGLWDLEFGVIMKL
jgi:hypothetical protein